MNFLAHLHLSGDDPGWILGGILGDFARGKLTPGRFPEPVQLGITLHREIDAFTDSHPDWRASKALLPEDLRRFAGIIIDIFYDHFLAKHWSRYCEVPLEAWLGATYRSLEEEIATLIRDQPSAPSDHLEEASEVIGRLTSEDWLSPYKNSQEISPILRRISHRSPRIAPIRNAAESFDHNYLGYESHFLNFYPKAIEMAGRFRARLKR